MSEAVHEGKVVMTPTMNARALNCSDLFSMMRTPSAQPSYMALEQGKQRRSSQPEALCCAMHAPQVLELLHFSEGYRRTWGVAATTSSALMLWDLVHKLVRFAAALGSAALAAPSPPTTATSTAGTHAAAAALPSSLPPSSLSKHQVQGKGTITPSTATEDADGVPDLDSGGGDGGGDAKGGSDGDGVGAEGENSGDGTIAGKPSACTGGPAAPHAQSAQNNSIHSAGVQAESVGVTKSGAALKSLAALLQPGKGVAARLLVSDAAPVDTLPGMLMESCGTLEVQNEIPHHSGAALTGERNGRHAPPWFDV
eukprot:1137765-Pelagomonas_calceolata.AAC.2